MEDELAVCKHCGQVAVTYKCSDCDAPTHQEKMGCSTFVKFSDANEAQYMCNACTTAIASAFAVHARTVVVTAFFSSCVKDLLHL